MNNENETKDLQPVPTNLNLFFDNLPVRIEIDANGALWFCAKDICEVLEYTNDSKAIKDHCREAGVTKRYLRSGGQSRELTFINEGNLYRLAAKSNMPQAEPFEAWVFDEVLPSIRKTGSYGVASAIPEALDQKVDALAGLMTGLKKELCDLRMSFYRGSSVSEFAYYCGDAARQDIVFAKDALYGIYVEEYCQALGYRPQCKSSFCMQIYRAVPSAGASTITVNGRRIPAIRGFMLLPDYRTIIEDKRLSIEATAREEMARRREHYHGIKRMFEESRRRIEESRNPEVAL